MPVSRTRKNRGKAAGAVERARRREQHNAVMRERMRQEIGVAPGHPDLLAAVALLCGSSLDRSRKKFKIL